MVQKWFMHRLCVHRLPELYLLAVHFPFEAVPVAGRRDYMVHVAVVRLRLLRYSHVAYIYIWQCTSWPAGRALSGTSIVIVLICDDASQRAHE